MAIPFNLELFKLEQSKSANSSDDMKKIEIDPAEIEVLDAIYRAKKYGIVFIPDPHPNQVPLNEIRREVEDTTYEEVKPNLLSDGQSGIQN